MSRRIEIELTSARPDGTWTWRAAGALKPRGVLDGAVLYEGAKAGDVVRADAEFEIDGITIVAVIPPKDKKRPEPERLEIIGPSRTVTPGVTASLVGRREGRGPDRRRRTDGERPAHGGPGGSAQRERPGGQRPGATTRRSEGAGERGEQRSGDRQRAPRQDDSSGAARGSRPRTPDRRNEPTPARPKARRLNPGNVHRNAVLESLPAEQRAIADQVLRGGIPAVRTALHLEREKAAAEGRPAPNADALLLLAEQLLPRLKAAEWRDRAEAASKAVDEVALRDLRAIVAGAEVARDEVGRELASSLREALDRRQQATRQEWLDEITQHLDDGRVVRALRLSARAPDTSTRLPAELATRLAEATGEAMSPDTAPDRWAALLEAVAASPVRRSVKPAGLPAEPGEQLLHAARQQSGRIPALAAILGITMPPPPGPVRPPGAGAPTGRPGARPSRRGPGRPSGRPAGGDQPGPPAVPEGDAAGDAPVTEQDGGDDVTVPAVHAAPPAAEQGAVAEPENGQSPAVAPSVEPAVAVDIVPVPEPGSEPSGPSTSTTPATADPAQAGAEPADTAETAGSPQPSDEVTSSGPAPGSPGDVAAEAESSVAETATDDEAPHSASA